MGKVVLLLGLLAACRFGFDSIDEPAGDDTTVTPEPLVKCGEPQRQQVGTATLSQMGAYPTSSGFVLLAVTNTKELRGYTYSWSDDDTLVPSAQNVLIDSDITGGFGVESIGDDLVVGALHGTAMAGTLGTTYHALDLQLRPRLPAITVAGRSIGIIPFAKSPFVNTLAGVLFENGNVAVRGVGLDGNDLAMKTVGASTDSPSELSIIPGHTGYAVSWVMGTGTPNSTKIALVDDNFNTTYLPYQIESATGNDTIRPRIAWAPTSNTYAITWYEKSGGSDDAWVQTFNGKLEPLIAPMLLVADAVRPHVQTDGTDFFIAYQNIQPAIDTMEVIHLTPSGVATRRTVGASGGEPAAYAMVQRAGQPLLVYGESGGNGPDLWFDAMCP